MGLYLASVPIPHQIHFGDAFLSLEVYKKLTVSLIWKSCSDQLFLLFLCFEITHLFSGCLFFFWSTIKQLCCERPKYALWIVIWFFKINFGKWQTVILPDFPKRQLLYILNIKSLYSLALILSLCSCYEISW